MIIEPAAILITLPSDMEDVWIEDILDGKEGTDHMLAMLIRLPGRTGATGFNLITIQGERDIIETASLDTGDQRGPVLISAYGDKPPLPVIFIPPDEVFLWSDIIDLSGRESPEMVDDGITFH